MDFTKKNSDAIYLQEEKQFFTDLMASAAKRESIYKELDDFFAPKSINQMLEYKETYMKWYVYSTWQQFQSLTKEKVLQAIMYFVPLGTALGVDVWEKLMWYFATRTPDPFEMESFFEQLKTSFFNSSFPMGVYKNTPVMVSELIKEIVLLNTEGNDSLKIADVKTKIQKLLFENGLPGKEYVFVETDVATTQFFNLVHFFIGVKKDRLAYIVDSFLNPTFEETVSVVEDASDEEEVEPISSNIPEVAVTPTETFAPVATEKPETMSLAEIRERVDAQFEKMKPDSTKTSKEF